MEDRLEAAESAVAHLARTVDELSDVLAAQAREIARLERRVALLMEREAERELETGGTVPLVDRKPPHW
jgi:SlyX protein